MEPISEKDKHRETDMAGWSMYDAEKMITERLEARVAQQAAVIEQIREALETSSVAVKLAGWEGDFAYTNAMKVLALQPCPEVLNKVRANAVRKAFKLMMDGRWRGDALDVLADRMELGEA
jgi:hypothetical protein